MLRRVISGAVVPLTLAGCAPAAPAPRAPAPLPPPTAAAPPPDAAPVATSRATTPLPEPVPPAIDPRTARLLRLCRIWGEVRYEHPWVATGSIDWDAALVAALPKAFEAQSDADEVAVVESMLKAIRDPATRVEPKPAPPATPPAPPAVEPPNVRVVEGVTFIPVRAAGWYDANAAGKRLLDGLAKAKLAVIDLRGTDPLLEAISGGAVDQVAAHLTRHATTGPVSRRIEHRGYRPQSAGSGMYSTLLAAGLPEAYPPSSPGPHPERVVFLAGDHEPLPDVAWAMQRAGDAEVVVQGEPPPDEFVWSDHVELPGGAIARLRLTERNEPPPRPDVQLDRAMPSNKVELAAIAVAKRPFARRRLQEKPVLERPMAWRPDATYAEEPYPTHERRVLSLFRFWSVIHYFYPYLPLMGEGAWDQDFADALPRFEAATNAGEYALAVAALAARIPDGHVSVWGSEDLAKVRGHGGAPFGVRVVEGQTVVTGMTDPTALGEAKLGVGDVIDAIDGEPIASLMARAARYLSASNDVTRTALSARAAFRGDPAQPMVLTLRGLGGEIRKVTVSRSTKRDTVIRTGPVFQVLESGFGYVDLDRLELQDVDAMFTALEKTPAIVFDMRGYPHETAWAIAPRLNVRKAKVGAELFEPFVSPGNSTLSFFTQPIPPTDKPLYTGKTVMLMDERTMSQAEGMGLFLEAANGTTFIGSQTAGADGDTTDLSLPGGLHVAFSGHDVRHADGRQLQRIGLVPDVIAKPTVAGIRAGRDEVLERAVTFLQTGK